MRCCLRNKCFPGKYVFILLKLTSPEKSILRFSLFFFLTEVIVTALNCHSANALRDMGNLYIYSDFLFLSPLILSISMVWNGYRWNIG